MKHLLDGSLRGWKRGRELAWEYNYLQKKMQGYGAMKPVVMAGVWDFFLYALLDAAFVLLVVICAFNGARYPVILVLDTVMFVAGIPYRAISKCIFPNDYELERLYEMINREEERLERISIIEWRLKELAKEYKEKLEKSVKEIGLVVEQRMAHSDVHFDSHQSKWCPMMRMTVENPWKYRLTQDEYLSFSITLDFWEIDFENLRKQMEQGFQGLVERMKEVQAEIEAEEA